MALASTIEVNDGTLTATGIIVGMRPVSEPNVLTELWRAPDLAGAPDAANAFMAYQQVVPPAGINYVDRLPLDGVTWWYRMRSNGGLYGPGVYTAWVNLGVAGQLSRDQLLSALTTDATTVTPAWQQQNARIGPQGNLLPNPGYEDDGLPWWYADVGTVALITNSAAAQSGNRYAELTSTTGVAAALRAVDDAGKARYFEVNTNDVVQWGGWAYRQSGTANVRYVLELTDKDKLNPTLFNTPNQNTAAWLQVQAQTIVGAGKKYARLWAEVDATGVATVARFDDAYLRIALGAIYDVPPPSTLYEIRFANAVPDPNDVDGVQTFIDFPATSYFMRVGQTPKLVQAAATSGGLIKITITAHGYTTGDSVIIKGHLGVTAANGQWTLTVVDLDNFTLNGSTFSGSDTPNTGHCVKLSLTIDGLGQLIVYAIVKAVSLVVSGVATFNGLLKALGGALFTSLQHSTTGNYGDTSMNRVMLQNNNVEAWGDAGTGTNNLAAMLGTHTVPLAGVLTARASKDVGLTAGSKGWQDPDGTDNGINTLTQARGTNGTVVAASRLWCKLGDPTNEGDNVDAYNDQYLVTFRVGAKMNAGGSVEMDCSASVTLEYSTDASFAVWTPVSGGPYSVDSATTTEVFATYAINVSVPTGSPTHVAFRLKLTVSTIGLPGDPSGTGRVLCFAATYRTDNYAVTWTSSSAGAKGRRGLKLPATTDGTDNQPHAYLEPVSAICPAANASEGEVQYITPGRFVVRRKTDWFDLTGQGENWSGSVATGAATAETDLHTSPTIKGGTLGAKGGLHITAWGTVTGAANTKTIKVKLGGTAICTFTFTAGQSGNFYLDCWLANTSETANRAGGVIAVITGTQAVAAAFGALDNTTPNIDTTADKTVAISGTTPNAADDVLLNGMVVQVVPGV